MTGLSGNTFFEGPAGPIEAILKSPGGEVTRVAVICHPHPLYGGTMHNKVVYAIARAFNQSGFATLRFNFRGVGLSAGEHDFGRGEEGDLQSAIDYAVTLYPDAELWIAGFSFGSAVAMRVACRESRTRALAAVGLPVSMYSFEGITACSLPKLFVQGEFDQFGPPEKLKVFVDGLAEPKRLVIIDGADHFFEERLDRLERAVCEFVRSVQLRSRVAAKVSDARQEQ